MNDRGIAALAYNVLLRPGVKLGFGVSFDTQNLKEASHKVSPRFPESNIMLTNHRSGQASSSKVKH